MKIFVINGKGGVGKDTFVEFFTKICNEKVENISSVDEVKEMARDYFGWKGQKSKRWRKILSDIKDFQTKISDGPFTYMAKRLLNAPKGTKYQFFHIREPEEIKRFIEFFGKKFSIETLLITNGLEDKFSNHADDKVEQFKYDYVIKNDGSLSELMYETEEYFEELKSKWAFEEAFKNRKK